MKNSQGVKNNNNNNNYYNNKIRTLGEKETYKYLGILAANTIKQVEMKEKINIALIPLGKV